MSQTEAPPEVFLERAPCPLGCFPQDEFVRTGRDRLLGLPGEFHVVRCATCGLMRTDPRPTPATFGYYYPDDYSPYQARGPRRLSIRDRFAARVHCLTNAWRIPALKPGRLFEFGCGPGGYLRWMAHRGWTVEGLEMSPVAAATARSLGLPVRVGTLETAPPPQVPCQLSVGWMVVEHLHEPVQALTKLAVATPSAGWLAISVPNVASREVAWFGDSWYALELPRHLFHFTPATITALLKKSGWKVDRIYQQRSVDNLIASCGLLLEQWSDHPVLERLARALVDFPTNVPLHFLTYPILFPIACVLAGFGQTGRMTVLAQKA